MGMKQFLITTVKFGVFAAVFYVVVLFAWGHVMPGKLKPNLSYQLGAYGHMNSRMKEVDAVQNLDVLFLGSSHAYRGFDPRIFAKRGISSFNLGSSSQTPTQTKILLERFLDKLNPKHVVYEVYPGTFAGDGVESALDIISNDANDWRTGIMALKLKHANVLNTYLYSTSNDLLLGDKASFNEPTQQYGDTYVKGGYVERELTYYKPKPIDEATWKFKAYQLEAFADIIEMFKQRQIKYSLVYAPITTGVYQAYTNQAEFDSIMQIHSNYYNFNGQLPLVDSLHFYDYHHLNQNGVELFNQRVIEELELK